MYDKINSTPIKDVIEKIGLTYKSCGAGEYSINNTDGWKFNEHKNFVTDFSNDRGQGGPFDFVKSYFSIDDNEVFEWYEKNFGIQKQKQKSDALSTWNSLQELSPDQVLYMQSRGLQPSKLKGVVKDFNGYIGCLIHKNSKPTSIVGRDITGAKQRFTSLKNSQSDGVYMNGLDPKQKKVYLVEGMFDFLTIRQYTPNVIGLRNWSSGIEEVQKIAKNHEIVYIPDTDEPGKNSVAQLQKYIDFHVFDLSPYNVKDINEIYVKEDIGDKLLWIIDDNTEYVSNGNIMNAMELLQTYQKRYQEHGQLGYDGPFPSIDKYTDGMIPGKVYTIGAYSNTGKSRVSYYYTQHFINKGEKVLYLSLEVDRGMVLGNIISATEKVHFYDVMKKGYKPDVMKYKNLKIFDDVYNIEEIEELVLTQKPDFFVLDFIQNVNSKDRGQYEKMANIAKTIQRITIQANCITLSLSQLANSTARDVSKGDKEFISLKGAGELYASSDVILLLYREDEVLKMKIEKNKYGKRGAEFELVPDWARNQFSISEDILF